MLPHGKARGGFPKPQDRSDSVRRDFRRPIAGAGGSPEAVLRRFAEVHPRNVAAVFFSWKLKPTEQGTVGNLQQMNILDLDPAEEAKRATKLRINYSIPSDCFRQSGQYLPPEKSVENKGPLYDAATRSGGTTGEWELALGQASGRYRVIAIPVWTPRGEFGPNGENAVAAIIEPLGTSKPTKRQIVQNRPSLF